MHGAIHEPDNALPSRAVLPENVRFSVAVEVTRTNDAPRCRHRSQIDGGLMRRAIHEPNNALPSRAVLPENVRFTVPVKVSRISDAPHCGRPYQPDGLSMR